MQGSDHDILLYLEKTQYHIIIMFIRYFITYIKMYNFMDKSM